MLPLSVTVPSLPPDAQFLNALANLFKPVTTLFGGGGRFADDGTQAPKADGREELFPSDCGRNTDSGTGKLCFPDGLLCKERE
jgi:hypothetical protein